MALWQHKNVKAWIYMNDHCDPHVTFDCQADAWKARIQFSMVKPSIRLIDVKPVRNAPSLALLNALANQLGQRLDQCRMQWWRTKSGELCIDNKPVERKAAGRVLMDGPEPTGRIEPKSGAYVAVLGGGHHVTASVRWSSGSVTRNEIVE